jgi:hypothetical protein
MGRVGCWLALVTIAGACDPCENERLATVGVEVSTVDADGNPVAVDSVTVRFDGGEPASAACRDILVGDAECTVFVAGGTFDDGTYEITATSCESQVTETVEVSEGHCGHAETELVVAPGIDPGACD